MKKSKIIIILGIVVIFTAIMINKPSKLEVSEVFNTPESLISAFNNSVLMVQNNSNNNNEISQNLYNFVSNRKRISDPCIEFNRVKIDKIIDLPEKEEEIIIKSYVDNVKKIKSLKIPEEKFLYRIEGIGIKEESFIMDGKPQKTISEVPINIDSIVIKENNGYVFDCFWINTFYEKEKTYNSYTGE